MRQQELTNSGTALQSVAPGRMPLRYGTDACCLVLSDSRYTENIVRLRNDPEVNRYIHHDHLTPEAHERWLRGESMRRDSLNFVILVDDCFAGTASLYNIVAGSKCEFGRIAMPKDDRRIYAVAAEFLCLSFAFEVLQVKEVYCTVVAENQSALGFYLRSGWQPDVRYDGFAKLDGLEMSELGLSMNLPDWAKALESNRDVLQRLHQGGDPNLD